MLISRFLQFIFICLPAIVVVWVCGEEGPDPEHKGILGSLFPPVSHNPDDIHFLLFSDKVNKNQSVELIYKNTNSVSRSKFIPNAITVIVIHGFFDNPFTAETGIVLRDAYLSSEFDGNFISVDWNKLAQPEGTEISDFVLGYYEVVKQNEPIVAERVGAFISWLVSLGVIEMDCIHIVGHSLGAHIGGAVGGLIQKESADKTKIWRITGLDPAGPLYEPPLMVGRNLMKGDATFVDAIHTNVGLFGDVYANGDADFFVNEGVLQPGCLSDAGGAIPCSHIFSVRVYVAGFTKPLVGCQCSVWKFFTLACFLHCDNPTQVGPYTPESARGIFFVRTSANP